MRKSELPNTVLIVRLSPAGEIVMATPVAAALKDHNPNTRIVWVTQPEYARLLQHHPHIDKVITWDKKKWRELIKNFSLIKLYRELIKIRHTLRQEKIDMALDLQGLFKSGLITWLSGATMRLGLGSREGSNWFMSRSVSRKFTIQEQMGAHYRYLIEQLGYRQVQWNMHVGTEEQSKKRADDIIAEKLSNSAYIALCPFSKYPQNQWPEEYWKQLALRIRGRYHLRALVIADAANTSQAEALAKSIGAVCVAGEVDHVEAAELLKRADLAVGIDNDYTHIAHLYQTPTIALFGATCPYRFTGSDTSKIIYLDKFCSPCRHKPTCHKQYSCMKDVTPDLVLAEIKSLLRSLQAA
jgi:heptosyltransferase-1